MNQLPESSEVNGTYKTKYIYVFIGIILYLQGYYLITLINKLLLFNTIGNQVSSIDLSSFFALIFLFIFPKIMVGFLNQKFKQDSRLNLVLLVSLIVFVGEIIYRNFQLYRQDPELLNTLGITYYIFGLVLTPVICSIYAGLFSWARINKLRNQSSLVPNLIILSSLFIFAIFVFIQ